MTSNHTNMQSYGSDPASPHTTFVQADPANFRAIVQKLTGASDDPSAHKLPLTLPSRLTPKPPPPPASTSATSDMGPRRPGFKALHERRQRKLDMIQLNHNMQGTHFFTDAVANSNNSKHVLISPNSSSSSPSLSPLSGHLGVRRGFLSFNGEMVMVSPVSPLDLFGRSSQSPRTPPPLLSPCGGREEPGEAEGGGEEEERAIAEKGFYLHRSPLNTPRKSEPELLPLFPLHSPREGGARD